MDYLLNIHTTTETAIVCVSNKDKIVAALSNSDSKSHAVFLHFAIHHILHENDISISSIKAVGVTGGPGSYTGIRVGLASAKGLCYALKIPLIMCNTLEVMAYSVIEKIQDKEGLYFPMIDARRMEVFTAVYDFNKKTIEPSTALILEEDYFTRFSTEMNLYFFGNGSEKLKNILKKNTNTFFVNGEITPESLSRFCQDKFLHKEFEDLADSNPLYVKDFYTNAKNI